MRIHFFLLLASLVVSSCNSDSDSKRGELLIRGNGAEATTLDPALAEDIHAFNILADTYEGLVAENASGDIIPGVAKSWQVSDDGLVYTFDFRADARWSNGDPVMAEDFVRAFRHVASPETASPYVFLLDAVVNVRESVAGDQPPESIGVHAISDTTLEIRLSAPTHHFLAVLTLPAGLPRHKSGDHLLSNGAYRLDGEETIGTLDLVKNPYYWDSDSVHFESVRYLPIADELAEFNMFRTGEIDVTHNIPDAMVRSEIASNASEVKIAPSLAFYYYAFDTTEAPFDNADLRRSLSMAVDREVIVSLLGRGDAAAYGIVPPGVANYSGASYDWSSQLVADRIEVAKRLFEEAGYSDNNPLQITLMYDAGGIHEKVAIAVSAMWEQHLGVETLLEKREWQYFLDSRDQRGDWDVMRFAWFGDYNAASTFLEIFHSSSEQNLSGYRNKTYDAQVMAASTTRDLSAANTLMTSAEQMLIGDYPVIPIYFFVSKHMVDSSIGGFETNVVDRHPSRFLHRLRSAD